MTLNIIGYIFYNAKNIFWIFQTLFTFMLSTKKVSVFDQIYFLYFYILHPSPYKSSYTRPSGSWNTEKGWTWRMLASWSTNTARHSPSLACAFLRLSVTFSQILLLMAGTVVISNAWFLLYESTWTSWTIEGHWLTQPTSHAYHLDQLTLDRKWGRCYD